MLCNESLYSDGQQVHHYQPNEQLSLILTSTPKDKKEYDILRWKPRFCLVTGTIRWRCLSGK
jgi:hypothetical protein